MVNNTTSLHPGEADGDVLAWRVEGMDCASCVAKSYGRNWVIAV